MIKLTYPVIQEHTDRPLQDS